MEKLYVDLGPWLWVVFGFILLVSEILLPGVLLIWIGTAALVVGAISIFLWDSQIWPWQVQWVVFAALSLTFTYLAKKYFRGRGDTSDQPFLNQREASLIGRTATLVEPITEGKGRIKLDDTWWSVHGRDMRAGTKVIVSSAQGTTLIVEAAD